MYYDFIQEHKRRFQIICLAIVVLLILWAVASYIDRYGKVAVTIAAVPGDASIMIDNHQVGNGTHWLPSGTYTVTAKKEGFASERREVIIANDKEQNVITISLDAKSDQAKKWASEHQDDYIKNQQYGGIEAESNGKYFASQNPITTKLPYTDPYFKIGYKTGDDSSIALTVNTPSPRYRFYAVEKIRQWGYDPTDFVIEFRDFKNPLESNLEQKS